MQRKKKQIEALCGQKFIDSGAPVLREGIFSSAEIARALSVRDSEFLDTEKQKSRSGDNKMKSSDELQAIKDHQVRINSDAFCMDKLLDAITVMGSVDGLKGIIKNTREKKARLGVMFGRGESIFDTIFNDFDAKVKILKTFIDEEFERERKIMELRK